MAKVKYSGPPGFAVAGMGEFEPGATVEADDELAAGLQHHPWFEVSGLPKKLVTEPDPTAEESAAAAEEQAEMKAEVEAEALAEVEEVSDEPS